MILALPKSKISEKGCRDEEESSFRSQIEHSYLDVLNFSALKYVKKEDSVVVSISESVANISFVVHILDSIVESGCEDVVFLIKNDKLIKSITKKVGKRGRKINVVRGSLLNIESDLGTVSVIIDICSVQHCLSKKFNRNLESDANSIFSNITQILKDGGRYLCMMDAEERLISEILSYFKDNWFIRFKCFQMSAKSAERSLDVYSPFALLTLTKLRIKLPKPVLEIATRTDKAKRVDTEDDIREELCMIWSYSHLQWKLRKELDLVNAFSIDYWCPKTNSESPRYTVHIVDTAKDDLSQYSGQYGVFIVPIGREISWLFASEKGRCDLAKMAGFDRLAVISTHRGHLYGDLEDVQQELSLKVLQLAPPGLNASAKVPFVTVGDDIGKRDVVFESGSDFDGHIVEDFKMDDGYYYRRLVFKKSPALVQSEFRILNDTVGNGFSFEQRRMDVRHLVALFHRRMVATLSFIEKVELTSQLKILLIGLGGGALPNFIASSFVNATVFCVELDCQIVDIAKKWFCLSEDSNVKPVVADGLEFMMSELQQGYSGSYDAILFDVNTDDDSMAITGPPMAFLEDSALENVNQLLKPSGVFTMNFVCRDVKLRMDTITNLKKNFKHVKLFHGDDDELNVVVMCLSPKRQGPLPSNSECLRVLSHISGRTCEDGSSDPLGFGTIISSSNVM